MKQKWMFIITYFKYGVIKKQSDEFKLECDINQAVEQGLLCLNHKLNNSNYRIKKIQIKKGWA